MRGGERSWFTWPERADEGRLLGGVCSGLADRLTIDVTLVRLGFMVLAIAWGIGLGLYGLLWIVMPGEGEGAQRGLRSRVRRNVGGLGGELRRAGGHLSSSWQRSGRASWPRPLDRRWVALTLISGGLFVILASLGAFAWLNLTRALGLTAIALGAAVLLSLRLRS